VATEYHLTPEGPRRCSVDRSNPNSRGCPLGGTHFDSFEDAMEVYTEDLQKTFGEFHVLVRASAKEKLRRVGYRSLEGIEKVKASPQVQSAVRNLKDAGAKARAAAKELQSRYRAEEPQTERATSLPDSIATEPLEQSVEAREAEELSALIFSSGEPDESLKSFGDRMMADSSRTSFAMAPLDRSQIDRANAIFEAQDMIRKLPAPKAPDRLRAYRSATKRRIHTAKDQARSAVANGSAVAKRRISDTNYAVRASASVARDTVELKGRVAAARLQDGAQDLGRAVQKRASLMSVPAGHIRPGDTFDGTTVRSVELLSGGRVKISYQASLDGPVLAATVPGERAMRVDRKTRREARNSLFSSRVAKPIAQSKALSARVARASEAQIAALGSLRKSTPRLGALDSSIRQHERSLRQRELIGKLRDLRTAPRDRVLQDA